MMSEEFKMIDRNCKADHEYHIDEKYEAGIVLVGTEVKSVKNSWINIKDGYARLENKEIFLYNIHIEVG